MTITRQQLELESCSSPLKTREVLQFRLKKISVWVVGLFGHVYITTGCFDRSVKTLDDINIPWEINNRDELVSQIFLNLIVF